MKPLHRNSFCCQCTLRDCTETRFAASTTLGEHARNGCLGRCLSVRESWTKTRHKMPYFRVMAFGMSADSSHRGSICLWGKWRTYMPQHTRAPSTATSAPTSASAAESASAPVLSTSPSAPNSPAAWKRWESRGRGKRRRCVPIPHCTRLLALPIKQLIDDIDLLDTVTVETLQPETAKYHPVYWTVFRFLELCLLDWIRTAVRHACTS